MPIPAQRTKLRVTELWRYPVKSLRGEQLDSCRVTRDGVDGDRLVHVAGDRGLLTGRTRHALLTLDARTGADGEPLVAGNRWDSPQAAAAVREAAGPDAHLVSARVRERFDVLPLLVATEADAHDLGIELRRLRPNIVIGGADPGDERAWVGHALQVGDALIGVYAPRQRCIVTTIDPATGVQDLDVLRRIRALRAGAVAVDCWTIRPGTVTLGDPVDVVPLPSPLPVAAMPDPGGWITGEPYRPSSGPMLPVACTLGPSDGAQRLEEWRRLVTQALADRKQTTGRLILVFRDLPSVGAELERLVAAERECCAFLAWNLNRADNGWQLEIVGNNDELQALSFVG